MAGERLNFAQVPITEMTILSSIAIGLLQASRGEASQVHHKFIVEE